MKLGALATATATTTLFLGAVVSLAPGQSANGEVVDDSSGLKFDHVTHSTLSKLSDSVRIETCSMCHGTDSKGNLAAPQSRPGAHGHQPCLSSGCHAKDFLSVGPRTKRSSPSRYRKAARFCMGCHNSNQHGEVLAPSPFTRARAENLYKNNAKPDYLVEMNHFAHTKRTACRTCHVVDKTTFALSNEGPGHAECATCHENEEGRRMVQCTTCHQAGDANTYFAPRTFNSDVRSCNSDRYRKLVRKRKAKRKLPCFSHEHAGHRTHKSGKDVQCDDCHFMFRAKQYAGHRYSSLQDIKQAPLMDNKRDQAHQKCGASGCHRNAVDGSRGTSTCSMCHSSQSIVGALFDTVPANTGVKPNKSNDSRNDKSRKPTDLFD